MRTKWLNLILHTSSLIHKTKEKLIASHGLSTVALVVYLFVLTFFFVLISTPFNLVSRKDKEDVKLRQSLSLTFLIPTMVLWLFKLVTVILLVFVFGYSWFSLQSSGETEELTALRIFDLTEQEDYLQIESYTANIDSFPGMKLEISGEVKNPDYEEVLISLSSTEDEYIRYFVEVIEDDSWSLEKNFRIKEVPQGTYKLEIAGVQRDDMTRSVFVYLEDVEFKNPIWFNIIQSLDLYLNYLIIFFVGISVFLTLIIL